MPNERRTAVASRHVELDAIRGTAVMLVVLYHAIIALDLIGTKAPMWLVLFNDAVSPFRIPTLVLLSGLLLPRSLRKPAGEYVRGKIRGLAWPYLVWTVIVAAFLLLGSHLAGKGVATVTSVLMVAIGLIPGIWPICWRTTFSHSFFPGSSAPLSSPLLSSDRSSSAVNR